MSHSEVTVVDLATELRRLAQGVVREARRDSGLACLSNLAAIRPLVQLLADTLTSEISISTEPEEQRRNPIGFSAGHVTAGEP